MGGSSRGLGSGGTKKGEIDHIATGHGPMVQGKLLTVQEASMAMDGLPEGVASPGRVPEQLLQATPILKWRWRRYRGEIVKEGSVLGVYTRGLNIGGGGCRGDPQGSQEAPWRGLG